MPPLRILVVDDSTLFRKTIKDALSLLPDIEVVGMVSNGRDALSRANDLQPDVITLDVEMPGMNGIEVLHGLQENAYPGAVVMISSHTQRGGPLSIEALELGAFDLILKPSLPSLQENRTALGEMFLPIAQAIAKRQKISRLLQGNNSTPPPRKRPHDSPKVYSQKTIPEIIAIGVSTGGPKALGRIIPKLPKDLPVPILIVQHMPPGFTAEFAKSLNKKSQLTVKEGEEGELLQAGTVYIAKGGKHMKIGQGVYGGIIRITNDPPENSCRPSVDYCLRSVCDIYGKRSLAIILTGMGRDGAASCQLLKKSGAQVIVQDEATSVVFGMPKAVIDVGAADRIYPLNEIHLAISQQLRG